MNHEGESCMWEISSTCHTKQEAKLIATKTNKEELAGGNTYLVADNCELLKVKGMGRFVSQHSANS